MYLANCSAPILNAGVISEPYNDTTEGAVIYFNCVHGFAPNERRMAVCQHSGHWSPEISSKHHIHTYCAYQRPQNVHTIIAIISCVN